MQIGKEKRIKAIIIFFRNTFLFGYIAKYRKFTIINPNGVCMNPLLKQKYETRAGIMKALAHPSRLLMIEELEKGPRCVCELQQLVGADMSTVSKHLSVLKNAGLVYDSKQGTTVYYHLKIPCVLDFIGCVDRVIEHNVAQQVQVAQCCTRGAGQ